MAFWAFNGVGLGLLLPNAQSLIADYFSGARGSGASCWGEAAEVENTHFHLLWLPMAAQQGRSAGALVVACPGPVPPHAALSSLCTAALSRGTAFGALYLTSALGGMLGALFATNMGHTHPMGLEGWRVAFIAGAA